MAASSDPLFAAWYARLREIAQSSLRRNGPQLTLSPTTLLHEVYMDISKRDSLHFTDRRQFMAYASRAMRGLIVDYVRDRRALKRGGNFEIVPMPTEPGDLNGSTEDLTQLSAALDMLAMIDASLAELVELKFFCGLSFGEIANLRSESERTVRRDWVKARLYLHGVLSNEE